MRIVGYSESLSMAPGTEAAFRISCESSSFEACLVRLVHGDPNPLGPGVKTVAMESEFAGSYPGRPQRIRPGSYTEIAFEEGTSVADGLTVSGWMFPTAPGLSTVQTVASVELSSGFALAIKVADGAARVSINDASGSTSTSAGVPVFAATWYQATLTFDLASAMCSLTLRESGIDGRAETVEVPTASGVLGTVTRFTVAAEIDPGGHPTSFYNGKISSPTLYARPSAVAGEPPAEPPILQWDFAKAIPTDRAVDVSGNGFDGVVRQRPMRAATGPAWTGIETAWRHAPEQYDAIHFHDDDLDDAGWDVDFTWTVPDDLASGVYAVHLRSGEDEDFIPFVVTPPRGAVHSSIAVLLPTFTYLAYANERVLQTQMAGDTRDRPPYPSAIQDRYVVANRLLSFYDLHSDGSGVCYASSKRPIVNVRPGYHIPWMNDGKGAAHGLAADLDLVDWLGAVGYAVDVVTDHDLHEQGTDLIADYDVVLTGSHPEYVSREIVDSLQAYVGRGGRLMYLGGNGLYWVAQPDESGSTLEMRRRGPATRVWEPAAGEAHLGVNGELGGLWRYRGRAPQSLLGVGFTAQGIGPGRPYVRSRERVPSEMEFVFEGLEADELIGDFPSLLNGWGAAGYEIDRADPELGTPRQAVILATATGFTDSYQAASEEIGEADSAQGGSVNPKVRSDMVLVAYESGGAVFSVGSIAWASCLYYNGYDNTVARVTRNVLERFLRPDPLRRPAH